MTEAKINTAHREKLEAEKFFYYIEAIREGVKLTIEQGLWVALMIDMLAISGKVYKYDEDGKETFLWGQRYHIIKTLRFIVGEDEEGWDWQKIGTGENITETLGKAFGMIFRFLKPLYKEMDKKGYESGPMGVAGKEYYRPLDPIPKMIAVFMLPTVLRLLVDRLGGAAFTP